MGELVREIRKVARTHGYAVGLHGSTQRDLDLIACPWEESASDPERLIEAIEQETGLTCLRHNVEKPHGRLGFLLYGAATLNGYPVDLSVMPRDGHTEQRAEPDEATGRI